MTINNNYFEDVKSIKRRQKVKRKSNLDREGERGGAGGGGGLASSAASRNTCKIPNVNFANILGVETPANPKVCILQILFGKRDDQPQVSPSWKLGPWSQHSTRLQSGWRLQRLARG